MKTERCHRLQGSRMSPNPIIIHFNWFADKQEVGENRRNLKGTEIFIREDFPQEVQKVRRSLSHKLTLARAVGKCATLEQLIIQAEAYHTDNILSEVLMLGGAGQVAVASLAIKSFKDNVISNASKLLKGLNALHRHVKKQVILLR